MITLAFLFYDIAAEVGHMAVQAVFIVAPLLIGGFIAYKKLWWILTEYRPHVHVEGKTQALTASGIRYPRTMNGIENEK